MPLQYIPDNTIGDAFAQLGNTIAQGPQTMLHAAVAGEQIRTSAQKRMELQNELDAKAAVADSTAAIDQLTEQKRVAGQSWTPDQEAQLIGAKTKFGEAVTKASSLLGKSAEDITKGVYASRGQQDLSIAPQSVGSPRYLQQMGAIEGKLPAPSTKEAKLENVVFRGAGGDIVRSTTDGGRTDALTGQPIDHDIPKGYSMLAMGNVSAPSPGTTFEDNAIHESLLKATQQIQNGQVPGEDMASLAAKYNKLYKTENMTEPGPNQSRVIVGLQKLVPNPTYAPLHQAIDNYYRTTRPTDTSAAPAGATGGNVMPGMPASLLSPQGLGGASTGVQTQTIPASQAPTQRLPQPGAQAQPGAPAQQQQPDQSISVTGWKPQAAPAIMPTSPAPGVTVTPAIRGFDQQAASRFAQDPIIAQYRVTDRGYNEMQRAAKYDSKYGDLHMIYTMAKMFDPGSAVRNEELTLANQAAPWASYVRGLWNYVKGGGRLDDVARGQMLQQAYTAATSNYEAAANLADQTQKQLLANHLDPQAHLPELTAPQPFNSKEINRYGNTIFAGASYGDPQSDSELIRMGGQVVGGAPGQTSTSAVGAPQAPAAPTSMRSGARAAQTMPTPAMAPQAPVGGPIQALLSEADAITGRSRRGQ